MKKLLVLLFSIMFSVNSYGEWKLAFTWDNGDASYLDYEEIKKNDGYVYWWELKNMTFGGSSGEDYKSVMFYIQGDCEMGRTKLLSATAFKELMGQEYSKTDNYSTWDYPRPNSGALQMLDFICDYL